MFDLLVDGNLVLIDFFTNLIPWDIELWNGLTNIPLKIDNSINIKPMKTV